MGWLEWERRIMDGAYSYIFLWNDDINTNIKATFSNLWSYQKDMPFWEFKDSDPFLVYDWKEEKYVITKNVTKIMNVFFKIKNILVEKLTREKRLDIAKACFNFIPTRCEMDLQGFGEDDIFAH